MTTTPSAPGYHHIMPIRKSSRPPIADAHDAAVLLGMPIMTAIARLLPEPAWRGFGRRFAPLQRMGWDGEGMARRISGLLGARSTSMPLDAIPGDLAANDLESLLQLCRAARPGDWRPAMRLLGAEHLEAARAGGKGVVIWSGHFVFASLLAKMALFDAGYRIGHLSHPRHGFSDTQLGWRLLNPYRQRIEARFLADRVELDPDSPTMALRTLLQMLRANGFVSLVAREDARRPVEVPFLDGTIGLASGAPDIAYEASAPLLPAFTVRSVDGVFETVIEPPLPLDRAVGRRAAVQSAIQAYARRLETVVLRHPGEWRGWLHASARPPGGVAQPGATPSGSP